MIESDVLKFGDFTLKSGRKSPFFMNAGAYVTGSQLKRLGEFYAKAIHEHYGDDERRVWVISSDENTKITLNFSSFNLEANYAKTSRKQNKKKTENSSVRILSY